MILLTEVRETPTSCDSRQVDLRGDASKQAFTSRTWAGVVAVKGGSLCPLLLFHTVPMSKLLYKGSDGIVMRYFSPWQFTSKLSLTKNR